jgi:hypothetical protein
MSGSTTGNYFEDDTVGGTFTIVLFEDPLDPENLKMEVRLNGTPGVYGSGGVSVRPELTEDLAVRLANALQQWYAVPEGATAPDLYFEGQH